jgi:hypothetical protein
MESPFEMSLGVEKVKCRRAEDSYAIRAAIKMNIDIEARVV